MSWRLISGILCGLAAWWIPHFRLRQRRLSAVFGAVADAAFPCVAADAPVGN